MEQIKNEFLEAICELCPVVDSYKIIEYADIKNNENCKAMSLPEIKRQCDILKDNGYIIKRFSDDEEICLCITGKTRRIVDDIISERRKAEAEKKRQEEERQRQEIERKRLDDERIEREKRDREEREERERLAEIKRQEAVELEKKIEQAKKELKRYGKDATKTLGKLEENKALVEEELREVEKGLQIEGVAEQVEETEPLEQAQSAVPQIVESPMLTDVNYKMMMSICKKSAKNGAIIGGIIGSILTGGVLVLVKFLLTLLQ